MTFEPESYEAPSMLVRRTSVVVFLLSLCAIIGSASFSAFLIVTKPSVIVPLALQSTLLVSWLLAVVAFKAIEQLMKKTYEGWPYEDGKRRVLRMMFRLTVFAGAFPLFLMACHDIAFVF